MNILQELGAQDLTIVPKNRTSDFGDNLVKNPTTAITFNGTSYAFLNGEGEIIRIKRVEELRVQKRNSNASKSRFKSTDSLKNYIEHTLVGNEYVLVNEYYFSEDSLSLRYEKVLFSDALDRYDYVSVRIDTSLNELETFYKAKSGFQLEEEKIIIPKEEAVEIANSILEMEETIIETRLATVKTNNYFNNSVTENELKLAYMINTADSIVYVDAYNAEVIGGDTYKVVNGGAIGASELTYASSSITLAKSTLENMGYTTTTKLLSTQFALDVPPLLKSAFYSCSHGSYCIISSMKNESDPNRKFLYTSVPSGTYKFVFLDACSTSSYYWKNAFGITDASTNKAFLGWSTTVGEYAAYTFCCDFWGYISPTYTVYEAAQDAADNDATKPISFTGDHSYNGYY